MSRKIHLILTKAILLGVVVFGISLSCSKVNEEFEQDSFVQGKLKAAAISLTNPGFESSFEGWIDVDPSSISSDANSGSRSAKLTGSGGTVTQDVSVSANTNYDLSAYVLGSWRLAVYVTGIKKSRSGTASDWKKETVSFNSGTATTITIAAQYNAGEGRFDDFSLVTNDEVVDNPGEENPTETQLSVASVTASANDGNIPENTIDQNLNTRWSAKGDGQYITYDLGASKKVSSLKIAFYKGDARTTSIDIQVGSTTSDLITLYSGSSAGNTLDLETFDVTATTGRYVRIVGHGNSGGSTWNSITEVEIYGTSTNDPGDVTPPSEVSGLSATAGNGVVSLSWINPSDSDFDHVVISYNGTETTTSGSSKSINNLTNDVLYTFSVVAVDASGNASAAKTVSATPTDGGGTAEVPSDLMRNCNQWKITYPTGSEDKTLCGEANNEFFFVNDSKDGIVFRVPIRSNNGSTPNSDYIRSELREREADGSKDIYWTTSGTHVVYAKQAITHLPIVKDHVVATQIHGNKSDGIDDAMVLRLEGDHLFLCFNGGKLRSDLTIKRGYTLGTVHEIIFEVVNDKHYCYYSEDGNLGNAYVNGNASSYLVKDGSNSHVMDLNYDQSYFKIGNYTQSNPDKEGSETDNPDNYGEVVVYDFWVQHQ